jgi:hypothetical protein
LDLVKAVNHLDLEPVCDELLLLRRQHGPGVTAGAAMS